MLALGLIDAEEDLQLNKEVEHYNEHYSIINSLVNEFKKKEQEIERKQFVWVSLNFYWNVKHTLNCSG